MALSAITNAFAGYVKKVAAEGGSQAGATSAAAAAMQEATETPQATRKEAAHGDRVAKAKLARMQQQQQIEQAPAREPGKGEEIDQKA